MFESFLRQERSHEERAADLTETEETVEARDPYAGVPLGVECAWPMQSES